MSTKVRRATRCRIAFLISGAEAYGPWAAIEQEVQLLAMALDAMRQQPNVRAWVQRR